MVYGEKCMSKICVFEWAKRFKEGRESIEDDQREENPVTTRNDMNVDRLSTLIAYAQRLSIHAFSDKLNIHK